VKSASSTSRSAVWGSSRRVMGRGNARRAFRAMNTPRNQSRHLANEPQPGLIWPSGKTTSTLEHVVAGDAVFEAMHPTGVLSHVAPELQTTWLEDRGRTKSLRAHRPGHQLLTTPGCNGDG